MLTDGLIGSGLLLLLALFLARVAEWLLLDADEGRKQ